MAKKAGGAKRAPGGAKKLGVKKGGVQKKQPNKQAAKQQPQTLASMASSAVASQKKGPQQGGQGGGAAKHTILLFQPTKNRSSRSVSDHPSVPNACEFFVNAFERELKRLNPGRSQLGYSVADLQSYVDTMTDVRVLVEEPSKLYRAHGKGFLKTALFEKLRSAAGKAGGKK